MFHSLYGRIGRSISKLCVDWSFCCVLQNFEDVLRCVLSRFSELSVDDEPHDLEHWQNFRAGIKENDFSCLSEDLPLEVWNMPLPFGLKLKRTRRYTVSSKSCLVTRIQLLNGEFVEFTLSVESTGQECLEAVAQRLELREVCVCFPAIQVLIVLTYTIF